VPTDDVCRGEPWWHAKPRWPPRARTTKPPAARQQGVQWLPRTAREALPVATREAFPERNPVNRALLRAARHGAHPS
jgi:hypothetical protein